MYYFLPSTNGWLPKIGQRISTNFINLYQHLHRKQQSQCESPVASDASIVDADRNSPILHTVGKSSKLFQQKFSNLWIYLNNWCKSKYAPDEDHPLWFLCCANPVSSVAGTSWIELKERILARYYRHAMTAHSGKSIVLVRKQDLVSTNAVQDFARLKILLYFRLLKHYVYVLFVFHQVLEFIQGQYSLPILTMLKINCTTDR